MLLLANKYQVDSIRRRIVEHLEADWPQSALAWERLEAEVEVMSTRFYDQHSSTVVDGLPLDDALPEPASAIRLARECNIPSILPAAFYHLSRLSIEDDWDRVRKTPGDLTEYSQLRGPEQRTAHWSLLDGDDMRRVLRGKANIRKYARLSHLAAMCAGPGDTIQGPGTCEFMVDGLLAHTLWSKLAEHADSDILIGFEEVSKEVFSSGHNVCGACSIRIQDCLDGDKFWNKLPELFELA